MMQAITSYWQAFLAWDQDFLVWAVTRIPKEYAFFVQAMGEGIVVWCMIFLVGLWLYGVYYERKKSQQEVGISLRKKSYTIAVCVLLTFGAYFLINFCIPQFRVSPQTVIPGFTPIIGHPLDNSFPSGHALFSGAFILALLVYCRSSWIVLLTSIIAGGTVAARVLGGVHYAGDIIFGLLFGFFGAMLCLPLARKIVTISFPFVLRLASFFKL